MKIKKIRIENFGPFKDSELNFDFTSALILGENPLISGASNGTGKSTIFQALAWVLTGNSRYKNSAAFIRDGQDLCKVSCWFHANGTEYEIIRSRNRANKATLDFNYLNEDGKFVPIKADTNSLLDKKISQITKVTYDSFVNTSYFAQNSVSDFMYGTASSRQALIAEILDIERWNTYAKKADVLLAEAEKELLVLRAQIKDIDFDARKKELLAQKSDLTVRLQLLKQTKEGHEQAIAHLQEDAAKQKALLSQKEMQVTLKKEIFDIEASILEKTNSLQKLKQEKDSYAARLVQLKAAIKDFGEEPQYSETNDKLNIRVVEREGVIKKLAALKAGKCDTCMSSWEIGPNRPAHIHEEEIKSLSAVVVDLDARVAKGKEALNTAIAKNKAWHNNKLFQAELAKDIEFAQRNLKTTESEIPTTEKKIENLNALLRSKKDLVVEVQDVKSNHVELSAFERELSETNKTILGTSIALSKIDSDLSENEEQRTTHGSKSVLKKEIEEKVNIYSSIKRHFSKTGIQAAILDSVIAEIETLTNNFMSKLNHKPFTVSFVTQKVDTKGQQKETLDISIVTPTSIKHIEDLSGGEQFRVAFSVRLALATVQARRLGSDIKLLLLDEVSSSLDKLGIETFVKIVKELEKTMTVMLITHDDSLKEHFDTIVKVSNTGSVAEIIQ